MSKKTDANESVLRYTRQDLEGTLTKILEDHQQVMSQTMSQVTTQSFAKTFDAGYHQCLRDYGLPPYGRGKVTK